MRRTRQAHVKDYPDYYMGWVIQPMDWEGTFFYVYPPDDTDRQKGFYIKGTESDARMFIENRSKYN